MWRSESPGVKQKTLQNRLKIGVSELTRYEMGLTRLPDSIVEKLAEFFGVNRGCFAEELSQEELEEILGQTWFRVPTKLSSEGKRSIEDFIAFVMEREENKR